MQAIHGNNVFLHFNTNHDRVATFYSLTMPSISIFALIPQYKDTTEAIVDATHSILEQCERSKTVRRVIHTGSVVASAPLREDGDGYKEFMNESCWTPLGVPYGHSNEFLDVSAFILGPGPENEKHY
jgi:nucleoside-diphosphate-sugar epimerase